jgi:hypothetical protein
MTDNPDGGGRITGTEIQDGLSNEIFDDVTDLDRVTGNVSLRKVYPAVDTFDTDIYFGSNIIIASRPVDTAVNVLLLSTDDYDDERLAARDKIQRYLVQSNESVYELLGNHFEGQQSLLLFALNTEQPPVVGDVYVLEEKTSAQVQYCRFIDVESELVTYTFLRNNAPVVFTGWRITAEISAPLERDFYSGFPTDVGIEMPSDATEQQSLVYNTEVADAARYWGIKTLEANANPGDVAIQVDSLFSPLVPAAQGETPLIDVSAAYPVQNIIPTGNTFTYNGDYQGYDYSSTGPFTAYFPSSIVPGSLSFEYSIGGGIYQDNGDGTITLISGSPFVDTSNTTINYLEGSITFNTLSSGGGTTYIRNPSYDYGVNFQGRVVSTLTDVTLGTRGFNYSKNFVNLIPKPGTTIVSYMVLGEWYTLKDDGTGALTGNGSGSVNFVTGTVSVTLQELPDVDSTIIWQYLPNLQNEFNNISTNVSTPVSFSLDLEDNIDPGTLSITYVANSVVYTITDNSEGELIGDGTGTVNYRTGVTSIIPTYYPDEGSDFTPSFNVIVWDSEAVPVSSVTNGTISGTFSNLQVERVYFSVPVKRQVVDADDTNNPGQLEEFLSVLYFSWNEASSTWQFREPRWRATTSVAGTLDKVTGAFTIEILPQYTIDEPFYDASTDTVTTTTITQRYEVNGITDFAVRYSHNGTAAGTAAAPPPVTANQIRMLVTATEQPPLNPILADSLIFEWAGKRYYDSAGNILTDLDPLTGAGVTVGSVNYQTGEVFIDVWTGVGGAQTSLNVVSGLTLNNQATQQEIIFRTSGAPIRTQSLTVVGTTRVGTVITLIADANGVLQEGGAGNFGTINYETGTVQVDFGQEIFASSALYNAVLITFLPLDPEIIGLDPVRLPSDGRVPIFRTGDVVVVHDEQTTQVPTIVGDATLDVGRDRLSEVRVYDSTDALIPNTQYSVNLDTGIVTWTTTPDTVTYPEPWDVIDRVEDMALINDVDISGTVNLTRAVTHNFTAGSSYISTALIMNDLQARVSNLFDQETWTGVWSDILIGSEPTSEYDDVTYPIEVENHSALQQRWAMIFTGTTSFRIVGETVGDIGTGTTGSDIAPVNPNTGTAYFTLRSGGWGSGWAAGNVLRFNTLGATYPVWIARTVVQSNPTNDPDQFRVQIRGNVNA